MTERERRRLYLFSPDMTLHPSDFDFVNENEALIDGIRAGRHEHSVPGQRMPVWTGVPHLREKPKLAVGVFDENNECNPGPHELLDVYGFGPCYVSSEAKALLSGIDPEGFDFVECDTTDHLGAAVTPYWMMDAIRVAELDEERSNFIRYADRYPGSDPGNPTIVALNDIYLPPGFPDSWHAFYFWKYQRAFVVDGVLADAWRKAGLTGARFTPLQPPTEEEYGAANEHPDFLDFLNYPYWHPKT